jgi:DNA adenine methylase
VFEPRQLSLFEEIGISVLPFRQQLIKWIGNKQRFAHEIIRYFPRKYNIYFEPFLGSGAVLGTLAPQQAIASDVLPPLMEIWQTLKTAPDTLKHWYAARWQIYISGDREEGYEAIKAAYNASPNGADLLFLSRSCYGGVVRFRKDGYMSTPCGIHHPISPHKFNKHVDIWHGRTQGTTFQCADFETIMDTADKGDLIYCDPPYLDTQTILYGAQSFSLTRLFETIKRCKSRGVYVVLSLDGTKKTGRKTPYLSIPNGLFEREAMVNCGRSMLRRFQLEGQTLEDEEVSDRLLLTY